MNKRRLTSLIRVLEKVPANKLKMEQWFSQCGTAACAAGHFVKSPAGRRLGFKHRGFAFMCKGDWGFDALETVFDINQEQSHFIFDNVSYPNPDKIKPAHVIKRVKQVMEGRE